MPNIATALRDEVSRLARKELKKEVAILKKSSAQHRRDIASLKRQVAALQKSNALLQKKVLAKPIKAEVSGAKADKVRFSAKGLASHRRKLGFSAEDYATLAGVSPLSVYNWEKGKTRPRKAQVVVLAELRGIGKREALARLSQLRGKKG
jgi:DNA-binding transcriptional regulator YiaG